MPRSEVRIAVLRTIYRIARPSGIMRGPVLFMLRGKSPLHRYRQTRKYTTRGCIGQSKMLTQLFLISAGKPQLVPKNVVFYSVCGQA